MERFFCLYLQTIVFGLVFYIFYITVHFITLKQFHWHCCRCSLQSHKVSSKISNGPGHLNSPTAVNYVQHFSFSVEFPEIRRHRAWSLFFHLLYLSQSPDSLRSNTWAHNLLLFPLQPLKLKETRCPGDEQHALLVYAGAVYKYWS